MTTTTTTSTAPSAQSAGEEVLLACGWTISTERKKGKEGGGDEEERVFVLPLNAGAALCSVGAEVLEGELQAVRRRKPPCTCGVKITI